MGARNAYELLARASTATEAEVAARNGAIEALRVAMAEQEALLAEVRIARVVGQDQSSYQKRCFPSESQSQCSHRVFLWGLALPHLQCSAHCNVSSLHLGQRPPRVLCSGRLIVP